MAEISLVLEGGGFRGVYTAGVLDVLQERGLTSFSSVFGVSAGAINAVSFKSGQIGRNVRIMLAFRDDRRFMSLYSLARTGNVANEGFLYDEVQNSLDPCDNEAFCENPLRFFAVATDVTFGTPAYFEVSELPRDIRAVQASASLPLLSKFVMIDGMPYLDGGTADSIPWEAALQLEGAPEIVGYEGADKALVVLTRDRGYVKTNKNELLSIRSHRYDDYPYYVDALASRYERYNRCREALFAEEKKADSRVLVIAPEEPVDVNTNEHNGDKLLKLYLQGRRQAEARLVEIDAFLND